jgi:hypothetical protein
MLGKDYTPLIKETINRESNCKRTATTVPQSSTPLTLALIVAVTVVVVMVAVAVLLVYFKKRKR